MIKNIKLSEQELRELSMSGSKKAKQPLLPAVQDMYPAVLQ